MGSEQRISDERLRGLAAGFAEGRGFYGDTDTVAMLVLDLRDARTALAESQRTLQNCTAAHQAAGDRFVAAEHKLAESQRTRDTLEALVHQIATDKTRPASELRRMARKFLDGHTPQIIAAMEHKLEEAELELAADAKLIVHLRADIKRLAESQRTVAALRAALDKSYEANRQARGWLLEILPANDGWDEVQKRDLARLEAAMIPARDALESSGPAAAEWERARKAEAFEHAIARFRDEAAYEGLADRAIDRIIDKVRSRLAGPPAPSTSQEPTP